MGGSGLQDRKSANDIPPPAIPEQKWSVDAGNGRLNVRVEWRDDGIKPGTSIYCEKRCRGKKHLLHSQCDDSCDSACIEIHQFKVTADFQESLRINDRKGWDGADQDFDKFGAGNFGSSDVSYNVSESIKSTLKGQADKYKAEFSMRHWFNGSCGGRERTLSEHRYTAIVHYELYREVMLDNGQVMKTTGPSGSFELGVFSVALDQYMDYDPYVCCRCSIVLGEEEHSSVPIPEDRQTGVCLVTPKGDVPVTDKFLQDCGFAISCDSMNECTVTAENPGSDPFELCVYPGTIFESKDPGVQDVATMAKCNLTLPTKELLASIGRTGAKSDKVSAKVRVACINMAKKEPTSKTRFVVGSKFDGALAKIAGLQSQQRIAGPWDQARTWVYTDKASYDDIAKILMPTPSKGYYARGLYQLANECGVDLGSKDYDKCFDPSLLAGTPPREAMSRWLATELARRNPAKLAAWLKTSGKEFAELLAEGDQDDMNHVQIVLGELAATPGDPVWKSLESLLGSGVPQSAKAKFAALGAGRILLPALRAQDANSATKALDIYESYGAKGGEFFLLNPNSALPQAVRDRALKLAKAPQK